MKTNNLPWENYTLIPTPEHVERRQRRASRIMLVLSALAVVVGVLVAVNLP
jgi:hypothetical protein